MSRDRRMLFSLYHSQCAVVRRLPSAAAPQGARVVSLPHFWSKTRHARPCTPSRAAVDGLYMTASSLQRPLRPLTMQDGSMPALLREQRTGTWGGAAQVARYYVPHVSLPHCESEARQAWRERERSVKRCRCTNTAYEHSAPSSVQDGPWRLESLGVGMGTVVSGGNPLSMSFDCVPSCQRYITADSTGGPGHHSEIEIGKTGHDACLRCG